MNDDMTALRNELAVLASNRETGKRGTLHQCVDEAAQVVVGAYFQKVDEARFMRTGGRRHYRVKGIDSRVALAGTAALWFYFDETENPARVWWALANNYLDLSELERGSVALLKRKNELLDVVRGIHSLMPDIEAVATNLFNAASPGGGA